MKMGKRGAERGAAWDRKAERVEDDYKGACSSTIAGSNAFCRMQILCCRTLYIFMTGKRRIVGRYASLNLFRPARRPSASYAHARAVLSAENKIRNAYLAIPGNAEHL